MFPQSAAEQDPRHKNRDAWNSWSQEYQEKHKDSLGQAPRAWGVWRIPESEVQALGDVRGKDILEFGCGGAQWSFALAEEARLMVGLDLSDAQLAHARKSCQDSGNKVHLVQASGEQTPFADGSFDLVFCDHGVMSFARPDVTVAEASRLLRPGGRFVFCHASPLLDLCWNDDTDCVEDKLLHDYFALYRVADASEMAYQLPYGGWIRVFRENGLIVEALQELQPPANAVSSYDMVTLDWARRWPAENLWVLRKQG